MACRIPAYEPDNRARQTLGELEPTQRRRHTIPQGRPTDRSGPPCSLTGALVAMAALTRGRAGARPAGSPVIERQIREMAT
jgi:hypothetical protein